MHLHEPSLILRTGVPLPLLVGQYRCNTGSVEGLVKTVHRKSTDIFSGIFAKEMSPVEFACP